MVIWMHLVQLAMNSNGMRWNQWVIRSWFKWLSSLITGWYPKNILYSSLFVYGYLVPYFRMLDGFLPWSANVDSQRPFYTFLKHLNPEKKLRSLKRWSLSLRFLKASPRIFHGLLTYLQVTFWSPELHAVVQAWPLTNEEWSKVTEAFMQPNHVLDSGCISLRSKTRVLCDHESIMRYCWEYV